MAEHVFGYTGRRWQADMGLYYYRARWYDPELGTFLQPDPIGSRDYINLYAYVRLEPGNFTDPKGMVPDCGDGLAGFDCSQSAVKNANTSGESFGQVAQGQRAIAQTTAAGAMRAATASVAARSAGGTTGAATARPAAPAAVDGKRVPNPYGKAGGPAHQSKIGEVEREIEGRGLRAERELRVLTPNGSKGARFVDVVGRDRATDEVREYHQVGRTTSQGVPVARERRARDDIEGATGQPCSYHACDRD